MPADGPLRAAEESIELPMKAPPNPAVPEKMLSEAEAKLASGKKDAVNDFRLSILEGRVDYARQLLQAAREDPVTPHHHKMLVQALRIGDWVIVGLSGECFFPYSTNARAISPHMTARSSSFKI